MTSSSLHEASHMSLNPAHGLTCQTAVHTAVHLQLKHECVQAGETISVPGIAPAFNVERDVADFLAGPSHLPGLPGPSHMHIPHHMQQQAPPWQQGGLHMPDASSPVTPFLQVMAASSMSCLYSLQMPVS